MNIIIDNFDFWDMEPQFYHSLSNSLPVEKRKEEVRTRIFSGEWYGARKMDGAWYSFIKDMQGNCHLKSRNKGVSGDYTDKWGWLPQLDDWAKALPNGTVFAGEVYIPGKEGSHNTTSIMGCLKEEAVARQLSGDKAHYYIFDVLAYNGRSCLSCTAKERFGSLLWEIEGENLSDFVEYANYKCGQELWDILQDILNSGGEGIVITREDGLYEPGKRPTKTTLKIKKELTDTVDCVITGLVEATREYDGKHLESWQYWEDSFGNKYDHPVENSFPVSKAHWNGWPGGFEISLYKDGELVKLGEVAGLTDEQKAIGNSCLGKVAVVSGMQIYKDKEGHRAIRHPRLISIREDKDPKQCTWQQVE